MATFEGRDGSGTMASPDSELTRSVSNTRRRDASLQISAAVRAAFESLGQLQRSSLELAHTAGMNVRSIAGVLGEDPAAVRVALREALLHLGTIARDDGRGR